MSDAIQAFAVLEQRLANLSATSVENVQREMVLVGDMLVGYIRTEKLSGQVLNERSGKLKRGVHHTDPAVVGGLVQMGVGVQGVPYAGAHEWGTTVSIPEYFGKMMKFRAASGDLVFTRRRRAYEVKLPERSYTRSAIDDKQMEIAERLQGAVLRSDR